MACQSGVLNAVLHRWQRGAAGSGRGAAAPKSSAQALWDYLVAQAALPVVSNS